MIKTTMGTLVAATAVAGGLTVSAGAGEAASRYTVEAKCDGGGLEVLVLKWSGYGLAMYVYEHGRLIHAAGATKTVTENSARMKLVQYKTGAVASGGASLRVRVRDSVFPDLEGSAHLTMKGSNDLIQCDVD